MKWKKQLCAAAAVLLALGIALAGVLLNQHFLVLSGGISRTEMQSPLGDLVRSHLQLVALIVFATLAAAILALYHYKKQPELRYFLLYLAVLFFWGTLAAFFPAGFQGLLQRFMRLFFAITILASALLSAALLALPLPAKWVVPASAVFLLLGQVRLPILRFGTLTAGIVGVSNIMLVTVRERTSEFGIRKAMGARPSSLVKLVLLESVLITAAFGYVGLIGGVGVMEAVNFFMDRAAAASPSQFSMFKNPTLDLSTAVSATLVLIVAGMIAGYVPARRAARIKAIDAMRHNK